MRETHSLRFALFRLDLGAEQLWRGEEVRPLTRKAFAALRYLVGRAGKLVTKDELIAAVWAVPYVSDMALAACIREIRRALGDAAQTPQFLETVRGRGYRFVAPITAVPVAPAPPGAEQRPAGVAGAPTLLVEREAELAQLWQGWGQALQGTRQVVLVTGEAGIGKTTLVDAWVAQVVATESVWVGRGQCIEQHGAGEAYLPLLEALGRLGRGPERERLVAVLQQQAPSWLVHLPAMVSPEAVEALQRWASGTTRERMLRELAAAVEALTAEQPLVLVLEDLHWSDRATLDWLAYVAQRRDRARLLVLGTYRPTDALVHEHPVHTVTKELLRHRQAVETVLGYLSAAGVAAYLAQRFGPMPQQDAVAQALSRRTDGQPFFLVTVVNELVRQGVLRQGETDEPLGRVLEAIVAGVPESLRQMITQHIEQGTPEGQAVLEAASVAGAEFTAAAVAAGMEQGVERVEAHCEAFVRRAQFVQALEPADWPDGTVTARYRFRHDLYREIIYERVPVSRRIRWHRQMGTRLETGYGERARELAAELAEHFVRGRDTERAVRYLYYAGEQAMQRSAYQEALRHFTKGLELLATLPETPARAQQEIDFQIALAPTLIVMRGFAAPEGAQAYTRAWELCQQVEEIPRLLPILVGLRRFYDAHGEFQRGQEVAEQLLAFVQRAQYPADHFEAYAALGDNALWRGEVVTARHRFSQMLALYDAQQHRTQASLHGLDTVVDGAIALALALWILGYPEQARQDSHAALARARKLADPYTLANTLYWAATISQRRGEVGACQEGIGAVRTLAQEHGFDLVLAVEMSLRGWTLVRQGQEVEGLRQLRQGIAAEQATQCLANLPYSLALLIEAYWHAGQSAAGWEVLVEGRRLVEAFGTHCHAAELHRLQGELILAQRTGSAPEQEAEQCFVQALAVACQQQAKSLELRAAMGLSRLWQQQGKQDDARQLLAPIYGWFTEGFDTADLQEARGLLEALS